MVRDQNQFTVVYRDTGWSLSSYSNSNKFPSQTRANATPTIFILKTYQLGRFDAWKLNKLLTLIPIVALLLHILLTGGMS